MPTSKYCSVMIHFLVVTSVLLSGCNGQIPIVGLDADGKAIETMVKQDDFEEFLVSSLNDLQESTIPTLDNAPTGRQWFMRNFQLGLAVEGSVGVGDYYRLGGYAGFRMNFTNKL